MALYVKPTKRRPNRGRKWPVHVIANCQQCAWEEQDFTKGMKSAYRHHKATGHEVHGEIGYAFRYGEKKR